MASKENNREDRGKYEGAIPKTERSRNPREDFRRYLEQRGVMDLFGRALYELYILPEKPEEPVDFIQEFFSENHRPITSHSRLRTQLVASQKQVSTLQQELAIATKRLSLYEQVSLLEKTQTDGKGDLASSNDVPSRYKKNDDDGNNQDGTVHIKKEKE